MRWLCVLLCVVLSIGPVGCNSIEEMLGDDDTSLPKTPPREDCTRHLSECLDTRLQSVKGGTAGSSRCKDCHNFCQGQSRWPDRLPDGNDCRWWDYR